jgi:CHAT domain-containing protein
VYLVPDRDLALLPFAALPLGEAVPVGDAPAFLGEVLETAVLPLAGVPAPGPDEPAPVLLAGQPLLAEDSRFPQLPWSAYELSHLRRVWGEEGTTLVTGAELSFERLRASGLHRYRTVHLATHAVASSRDPRRCGVVLSGEEMVGLDEIARLELGSSLVVLSACRTGQGELIPGEGVVGLGWAFLRAGAGAVVVSHWVVDDAAAARLMIAFHERLRAGDDPVAALAAARRELAGRHPHPAYWAPFVVLLRPER